MADYLLTEAEVSDDGLEDGELIEPISKEDLGFINDDDSDHGDVNFYRMTDKKLLLSNVDEVPVPVLQHNVGKLKTDSESQYKEEEEQYAVPNSEDVEFPEDSMTIIPERMRTFYGTDHYEWNHYKRPTGEACKFQRDDVFIKTF